MFAKGLLKNPVLIAVVVALAGGVVWYYWPESPPTRTVRPLKFPDDVVSVMFVGNSYTGNNRLPFLVEKLAESADRKIAIGKQVILGTGLDQHLETFDIEKQEWQYLVLQGASMGPLVEKYRNQKMVPAIREFDARAKQVGGRTLLFATWARKNGSPKLDASVGDYQSAQSRVNVAFEKMAHELGVDLIPVGRAWQKVVTDRPELELYNADGSHPSALGSYLAACVIFAHIFETSPVGSSFDLGLGEQAKYLQSVAAETVLGIPTNDKPEPDDYPQPNGNEPNAQDFDEPSQVASGAE